jgi:hypothetical protein
MNPYNTSLKAISDSLSSGHLQDDAAMTEFRRSYLEPISSEMKLLDGALAAVDAVLDGLGNFFKSLNE